jgi:hypothetical protein
MIIQTLTSSLSIDDNNTDTNTSTDANIDNSTNNSTDSYTNKHNIDKDTNTNLNDSNSSTNTMNKNEIVAQQPSPQHASTQIPIIPTMDVDMHTNTQTTDSNSAAAKPTNIFQPPQHMRGKPCFRSETDQPWQVLPWDVKTYVHHEDDAWVMPLEQCVEEAQLQAIMNEDRSTSLWRQDFEYSFGSWMPLRHLNRFIAEEDVEANISHYGSTNQGLFPLCLHS